MLGWKGDFEPGFPEPSAVSGILLKKGDEKMEKLRRKKKLPTSSKSIVFRSVWKQEEEEVEEKEEVEEG